MGVLMLSSLLPPQVRLLRGDEEPRGDRQNCLPVLINTSSWPFRSKEKVKGWCVPQPAPSTAACWVPS